MRRLIEQTIHLFTPLVDAVNAPEEEGGRQEISGKAITVSHLNLVDLAGSERASQTGATGERLREGAQINNSLMVLGQVITRLSEGISASSGHIPYRNSNLTRFLKNSLGGNSGTAMICTVTPVDRCGRCVVTVLPGEQDKASLLTLFTLSFTYF